MRGFRRFVIASIMVSGVLSLLAQSGSLVMAGLFLAFLPGLLLIAAPTVLVYSLSLLPAVLLFSEPPYRRLHIAIVLSLPALVALMPGALARYEVWLLAKSASESDFAKAPSGKPKTIEIIADELTGIFAEGVGDSRVPCGDVCQRLLFNHEVEQVRLTKIPAVFRGKRHGPAFSVTYHAEQRTSCPDLYSPNSIANKAIRDRLAAGECLIFDTGNNEPREATLDFTTLNHWQLNPVDRDMRAPVGAIIERIVRLQIARQQLGAAVTPVEQRTETKALTLSIPFYIGYELHMQGGYNGPVFGRDIIVDNSAAPAVALRRTFGFAIADIAPISGGDSMKLADRIFSLPSDTVPTLSRERQGLLAELIAGIANKPDLTAADFDFVLRLLNEPRIAEPTIGFNIQKIVKRYPGRLSDAIPVMLDRIETPALQSDGRYQTSLAWTLMAYPADALQPHRVQIVRILENEKWAPTGPLLARVAELGEPPLGLIADRLKSKAPEVRGSAALAICRADSAAWPKLEPIALSHLAEGTMDSRLQDEHRKLILALVRFGNKAAAAEALARLLSRGQEDAQKRLATFEPGFGVERCRDYL